MLSCLFNSTYSKVLHDVNYVLQETFCKKHCAIWQSWLTEDPENKQTKNFYSQHTATCNKKSAALYAQDENYLISNILGRTTNVAMLKSNIKINKLAISCFDKNKSTMLHSALFSTLDFAL